jgi:N-acetylglutamate synthase-like GNAT family acetyltransferase
MKEHEGVYELVKMAVTAAWQGRGLSKILVEKCLATAREWNVKKVFLFSSSKLQTALKLYQQYGFKHVKAVDAPYETADVRMELDLA